MDHSSLRLRLPDGTEERVGVRRLFNAGFTGTDRAAVERHVEELAELGVPAPAQVPDVYRLPARECTQATVVEVSHDRTSGEAEWALVRAESGWLVAAASDHSDRELERTSLARGKQACPDVIAEVAWRYADVRDELPGFTLEAWVAGADGDVAIQSGVVGDLTPADRWIDSLAEHGLDEPGTVLLGGTIPMLRPDAAFSRRWTVALTAPDGRRSDVDYSVEVLDDPTSLVTHQGRQS